ncbi:hypothetical protein ACQKGC_08510 [Allorhizobium pseudoryzae]|uniref:hypothetical protein n=1 Tax=Allorhizobium pseudoryzae TaxID=379684 RepID=UPI0013ED0530|nr:hypothetical protein [Allorhizobium pseudoryzae]
MSRIVVIGIPGEDGLWMADLDAGTVTPVDAALCEELALTAGEDAPVIRGVKMAVAIGSGSDIAGGFLER